MTATTSTTTRAASKGRTPRNIDELVKAINATPVLAPTNTSTSSRKRAPRATPRTVPPTVADVVLPVGLDLDADIADVVATHGTLDTIESGHAAALVALTERTDYALSEYVRLARVWKSQRRAIGGFHVAIGSGDKNTHRRLRSSVLPKLQRANWSF